MAKATLSALLSNASGSIGQDVIYLTRQGLAVRPKPRYRQFPNPATAGARSRMLAAKAVWESLTLEQVQAWRDYAAAITIHRPLDGAAYSPIAYNAFTALATRVLQADPTAAVPLLPPSDEFIGERIQVVRVQGLGSGVVRFWASGPNSAGVVTELMAQRLANIRRMPKAFYKSLSFVAFASEADVGRKTEDVGIDHLPLTIDRDADVGRKTEDVRSRKSSNHVTSLQSSTVNSQSDNLPFVDLNLEPGPYAFAYRFVKSATGQTTEQWLLGVLEVS